MRKTFIVTIVVSCFVHLAQAQFIAKDKKLLGGSIGLGFSSTNDSTDATGNKLTSHSFYLSLSPSYGKAIKDNLVFGEIINLGFNATNTEDAQNHRNFKSSGYQIGANVFWEKFFPLNNRLAFSGRLSGGAGYSWARGNNYSNNVLNTSNVSKNFTIGASLVPILSFKLNQHFLLGLSANDFLSVNFINGTTEVSGPNLTTVKSMHTNFFTGTMINYNKALADVNFSFRYLF